MFSSFSLTHTGLLREIQLSPSSPHPPLDSANSGNERPVHTPGRAQSSARFSWRWGWGSAGLETQPGISWWRSSPWSTHWSGISWGWCPWGSWGGHLQVKWKEWHKRSDLFLVFFCIPLSSYFTVKSTFSQWHPHRGGHVYWADNW